ncbi:MAG: tryptophan synthase subunit beta [Candidatus Dormibacteraeota bacterium]|nr:tryptophan synthase subunit beta [Candidatus Dormibacteraeota bacterium]MBO0745154.1 tryptophan synthase subunit beta [Candidatus Dormibacteraeota bacterium]
MSRSPAEQLRGRFGPYGGQYVPETLMVAVDELETAWREAMADERFLQELRELQATFIGRPTPLHLAQRLSERYGVRVYLKREDLCHTGAHKLNNALGQALLARRMGKRRIIAETGAGQHGVATATVCARFGLDCVVYMGQEDMRRQAVNVQRMRLLGAEVRPVTIGSGTLAQATSEAIRDWVTNVRDTYYILGSAAGPHPYPSLVRDFQRVIGDEARGQILGAEGRLPDAVVACVGGGSNAIGIFTPFVPDADVRLVGVEAGGRGSGLGDNAATLVRGRPGILHGAFSYLLQDGDGQIAITHSISAGLDYPGVGPEHAMLRDEERADYHSIDDGEAVAAFLETTRLEGIVPALESSHALAEVGKLAPELEPGALVLVCLSGRGDKDLESVEAWLAAHPGFHG